MATIAMPSGNFDIGRVIQRIFSVIGRNFALFAVASLLIVGLPTFVLGMIVPQMVGQNSATGAAMFSSLTPTMIISGIVVWLVTIFVGLVLQAVLIRATIFDLASKRADLGESLKVGLLLALPLLGLSFLIGLGVAFATMLLIVPGIMLYCAWSVAVPALVAERQGVFASLGRSRELTKGSRWKIFALLLIYIVIYWIIGVIFGLFSVKASVALIPALIFRALLATITTMLSSAGIASMYVELRSEKEGASFENLVEIFQ